MEIQVRLNKNFTTAYNKMQAEYGEEFAKLNGFGDKQLSYTDFIQNFIDTETVADASVDGNANVGSRDMRTLMNEMPKPHRKLLAYNKIYYELNKKYGFKTANEWLEAEWTKALYLHDADTSTFVPYCYKGEEMLVVTKEPNNPNGARYNITFKELEAWDLESHYDESIGQDAKFPKDLYVLDIIDGKEVWTKIKRIVKHKNDKPMRFIKYANGLSQIVTEDHPIITKKGDIAAKDVTEEDCVYTVKPSYFTNGKEKEQELQIPLNKEIGWLTGLALSEASSQPSSVRIRQKEEPQRARLLQILEKYEIPYSLEEEIFRLKVHPISKFLESILLGKTSSLKCLPEDYNSYPYEFLDGVVAGMIDGDGTLDGYKNRHCQIRIASQELVHQLSNYLNHRGIFCGDRTPHIYFSSKSYQGNYPLFGIGFSLTDEEYFSQIGSVKIANKYQPLIRKKGNFKNKKYQYNYEWVNILENTLYIDECPYVYDITTETGHFICNNILSHNCFAYDLKDVAEKGLFFLSNFNAEPPRHLATFIDFVKEFISFCSNRTSGACGLPNIIPYMYYFWKKDCEEGYATKSPEYHAKQQIQRFVYAINQPYVRDRQNTVR